MFYNSLSRSSWIIAACLGATISQADLINFDDGQTNGTAIGSFYSAQGVTFAGGAWTSNFAVDGSSGSQGLAGTNVNATYIPPTTPIVITFSQPVSSASIQACDVGFAGALMKAYDAPTGGNLVGSASFAGPGAGLGFNTQLSISGDLIYRVELSQQNNNGLNGDGIVFDDLRYTPVPEPASIAALGFGALAMFRRRARK